MLQTTVSGGQGRPLGVRRRHYAAAKMDIDITFRERFQTHLRIDYQTIRLNLVHAILTCISSHQYHKFALYVMWHRKPFPQTSRLGLQQHQRALILPGYSRE